MTPEQIAKSGTEHAHQTALFCWCNMAEQRERYPELQWLFAVPNGGERNRVSASRMKAEGVKRGVCDMLLPVSSSCISRYGRQQTFVGAAIELKRPGFETKPLGGCSQDQIKWLQHFESENWYTSVAYGWEHARDLLQHYLNTE